MYITYYISDSTFRVPGQWTTSYRQSTDLNMALPKLIAIYSVIGLSLEWSVASAGQNRVPFTSVGTFNAFLFRGAPGFPERKEQLIKTVSFKVSVEH